VTAFSASSVDAEIADCQRCNPASTEHQPCDRCWDAIQARISALLALPEVGAILTRIPVCTEAERRKISDIYVASYQVHRVDQMALFRRVRNAYGDNWRDLSSACQEAWSAANAMDDGWAFAAAVSDVVYGHVAGELLTDDERRLFTRPWTDVCGQSVVVTFEPLEGNEK
jgi:hypothetical protein